MESLFIDLSSLWSPLSPPVQQIHFTPPWSTSPSPTALFFFFLFSRSLEMGEKCIDRTGCNSEGWERHINLSSFVALPESISISSSRPQESVGVSTHVPTLPELCTSPYDCKLRVNFHCWLRLRLQISRVSPPILALRLSRQRLLPTWRSFELDSICSHFWGHTNGFMALKGDIKTVEFCEKRFGFCLTEAVISWQISNITCLLSFSRQPCSLMREPAVLSTTVRHKSMCLTDLSLVRAHSFKKGGYGWKH